MSHYTLLIIGNDPEEQLKPFDENLRTEFNDKSEEYRKEYETEIVDEFYCGSSSSWGFRITEELYKLLKESKPGRLATYAVEKLDPMSYLKLHGKYRGYYTLKDGKRCKGTQWFEVDEIVKSTHPNPETCFEGEVMVRKISPPKKIALKDRYPVYEDYLRRYHGVEPDHQGYDYNPQAKWDWYQLGGRWTGYFKMKSTVKGNLGTPSLVSERRAKHGTADQAYKRDIDFDKMMSDNFEEASKTYDEFEKKFKEGNMESGTGYFEYGVRNIGKDAKHYVPESREQYLKRHAGIATFAVLKDGKWYEKGEMGWWGIVHDEKNPDQWDDQFMKLLKELPDDTLLSVYDCHI